MSSAVKIKLKNARDALNKKDWEKAKTAASDALDFEPDNYNANVFLGLALLELGDIQNSEQSYLKAIQANADLPLAWQGLSQLYSQSKNDDKYGDSLYQIALIFSRTGDAVKCAEPLQKLLDLHRKHGDQLQVARTLGLFLPESPFYPTLSELPPPDATNPTATTTFFAQTAIQDSLPLLEEIVSIHEKDEGSNYDREVDARRKRLGAAGPEEVRKEVVREIWSVSKLPKLYQEVINHPNTSDELRRETEAKLLEHRQRLLFSLPSSSEFIEQKKSLVEEVQDMISGMVLLGVQNELAWTLFIEGKDAETMADYDYKILTQFIGLFPHSKLAQLLAAYLAYNGVPTSDAETSDGSKEVKKQLEEKDEDYGAIIMDLFPEVRHSIIAHRCTGEVYQREEDYENAIKIAESGLAVLRRQEAERGTKLPAVRRALNVLLGVSLVHFFSPKHHVRALRIIDEVLQEDPDNIQCLMSRGCIMQAASRWGAASSTFQRVAELLPDDLYDGLRAREEDAWCKTQAHDPETGEKILQQVIKILDDEEGRENDSARAWWRSGKAHWAMGDLEQAYRCFITSLKRSSSYAPSFTALGIYYAEAASPPDPARASKCFQKAFELDPRETEAARRLAFGFAEEREWDLVEVVARRTIEGEGGHEGGADAAAPTRFQPLNSWAWKALGVVDLNRQRYSQAIEAFQIALRSEPDDALLWLRLGEAYSKAGSFAASLKALERARELDPDDWISSYFLGEVRRQMGQFQEAIDIFSAILEETPSELRVLLSLGQSHLEFGRAQLAAGFSARAESSFVTSIQIILRSIDTTPGFRRIAWKVSADALYEISRFAMFTDIDEVLSTVQSVLHLLASHSSSRLSTVISLPVTLSDSTSPALARFASQVALLAYDYRITLGSLDDTASASAYYDLGMVLCSYTRGAIKGSSQDASQKESVTCLKEALKLDPYNDRYWNTFGNGLFIEQPKVAQHAYIRALEIDSKNVRTWTNLGFLYLYHSDLELANEAFCKAQVLDPDFAAAWVGQGLVAVFNDHQHDALALFEHATGMAVPVPEADMAFAERLFDRLNTLQRRDDLSPETFSPAFFVLDRFCKQRPQDATAQHLFGLVCERLGHLDLAVDVIGRAIVLLEADYEECEDPQIEQHFAIAHTNLARLRLMRGDCEGAQESSQVVLGLLGDSVDADETHLSLLAQAQLWSGLASFKLGQLDAALESLEAAFETATSSDKHEIKGHIVVVIAQVLWAIGSQEGREAAKERLLQSIETDPDNLAAVNTLAGMGVLTEDDGLVDAALSEILALPLDQRHLRDPQRDVTYLLVQHYLGQGDIERALSISEKAVMAEPTAWQTRHQLASLQLQRHDSTSARALLRSSASSKDISTLRESLALVGVAEAQGDPATAQQLASKAIMLTPWDQAAWRALAYARSCGAIQT